MAQTFITIEDFKAVVDDKTLSVINQSDPANLDRAVGYAIEEISGYLRGMEPSKTGIRPYDIQAIFSTSPPSGGLGGADNRNRQLVMYTCDVALYHLISWLPQKMGFEIRQIRYGRAISWLEDVQAGKVILDVPLIPETDAGDDNQTAIRWGSWNKNKYDY